MTARLPAISFDFGNDLWDGWIMKSILPFLGLCAAILQFTAGAADKPALDPNLEPFRPFLGKTWRGEFKNSTPEKPVIDVVRWERVLNGKAVRAVHSVNDGAYGGESIIRWDNASKKIAYHYFTTAGFMTMGTLTVETNRFTAVEQVVGSSDVTEVRSVTELRADGSMLSTAEYRKDGKVTGSREVLYKEAPGAEVKFK